MQQLLAVLLGWLSETPDPDLGLLGLRNLSSLPHQRDVVVAAFRDSPELARRLCVVLGTSRRLGELVQHYPAVALSLGDDDELFEKGRSDLSERALAAAGGGGGRAATSIRRLVGSETLRTAAADLFLVSPGLAASRRLSALADVTLEAALEAVGPSLPFAVVAMGRLGGEELAYASDLDVLFVYEGGRKNKAAEAEQAASRLLSLLNGSTPAERIWTVDASLRPEGKQGPLARSLDAYAEYYDRWMAPWERQALLRARPVGGDEGLLDAFMALVERTLWERPFGEEETREIRRLKARTERERIPAGEDPQFHLKLGRGSLADIEWTTQLLQLRNGVPATTTAGALAALANGGVLEEPDRAALATALAYLTATRNRWHLVGNYLAGASGVVGPAGADSLPQPGEALSRLARSLGKRPTDLRQEYRRVTRRARRVVERLFYGLPAD
jgi:glutamate-ammonia-ligase adenylyltransferase